jgi:hypothetical protein
MTKHMPARKQKNLIPDYKTSGWIPDGLPTRTESWLKSRRRSLSKDRSNHHAISEVLQQAVAHRPWKWPRKPVYFFADPHADAEAFSASLAASGGAHISGKDKQKIKLTETGRNATFIIGGDCLDKGPANLPLLRRVYTLMQTGARVKLLTGNHDVRLLMGIRSLDLERDPTTEHLFLRMGAKVVPLLKEIHNSYLKGMKIPADIPGNRDCRRKLFPSKKWFDEFPREAAWLMPEQTIERELARMQKKLDVFEQTCDEAGLNMRAVYATTRKCKQLFLEPDGEFYWFFKRMQLLYRTGSFLFIHAGFDDRIIRTVEEQGFAYLNRLYRKQVKHDLFEFYYGPLANTMRTKYREVDMPLTRHGVEQAYRQGVHAVVHGHRNRTDGQRIMLRQGMIHIESDITMDRNSRKKEGLAGYGTGVTIIRPEGQIIGISTDYPCVKVFEPEKLLG